MTRRTLTAEQIDLEKDILTGSNLIPQEEFMADFKAIARVASEVVSKTLGPYAHTTIIDDGAFTYPTKDGWNVLSRLKFSDPLYNSIFRTLKQISFRIVDLVGDGTTTAMVTAQHFIDSLSDYTKDHPEVRQADIVNVLKFVSGKIQEELNDIAIPVVDDHAATPAEKYMGIYNVANVSSNGNQDLAHIMYQIYAQTNNPNVLVDMNGTGKGLSYEIQRGYRLDCAVLMKNRYINTSEGYYITGGMPHIFTIFDHNVTYSRHADFVDCIINNVADIKYRATGQPHMVVLIAPHFDDVFASTIAAQVNEQLKQNANAIPGIMLVQIPELSRAINQKYLSDFAAVCGTPITRAGKVDVFRKMRYNSQQQNEGDMIHDASMDVEEYSFKTAQALLDSCVGIVTDATFGKDFISINTFDQESTFYKEAIQNADEELAAAKREAEHSTTSLMKNLMEAEDRRNRLGCSMGIIHVGGESDLERQCTMDVVDDTFRACRSAYESGIVPGMNMGVLVAIERMMNRFKGIGYSPNSLELALCEMFKEAYTETTLDMMANKKDLDDEWVLQDFGEGVSDKYPAWELIAKVREMIACSLANLKNLNDSNPEGASRYYPQCYDMVTEELSDMYKFPTVINSASTDVEILKGIVSILGTMLTSNQYLSVARFYDKAAAEKAQKLANERDLRDRTKTIVETAIEGIRKFFGR